MSLYSPRMMGYNPGDLERNYNNLSSQVVKFLEAIIDKGDFYLDYLARHWAAPEAVVFCEDVASDFNKGIRLTAIRFSMILNAIKASGDKWSNATGHKLYLSSKEGYIKSHIKTLKSTTVESINGLVGADVEELDNLSTYVWLDDGWGWRMDESMSRINVIAVRMGFIGGSQIQRLISALESAKKEFDRFFYNLEDQISSFAKKIANKYKDQAGAICDEFRKLNS